MLKTGIYTPQQIKKGVNFKGYFGGDKKVSITLYDQILDLPNAEELAERILLLFSDERGAYKRTYRKRFETFDPIVLDLTQKTFQKIFKTDEDLSLQDVGVSDGRTAVDFFEKIGKLFPKITYRASDYNPKVYVLQKESLKVTLSQTGKVLEILWPPFIFNAIKRDAYKYYPLNHLIRFFIQFFKVKPLVAAYKKGAVKAKDLLLFAPNVLNTAKNDPRFLLEQHDLLKPFKTQSHIIRAMNVLNTSYFSGPEFEKVMAHIYDGLLEGGLFITGSNQDAGTLVHGGVYKKTKKGFDLLWQSGEGSQVHQYIQNLAY